MKYKTKRVWLCAIMLCFAISAYAHDSEIDGIYYNFTDSTATVTYKKNYNSYWGTVNIPERVTYNDKEYSVTTIGKYAFYKSTALVSVTMPQTIVNIDEYAFSECTALSSVQIPETIKEINKYTFKDCTALVSMSIPENVISIGQYAFSGCTNLRELILCDGDDDLSFGSTNLFADCPLKKVYLGRNLTGSASFKEQSEISSLIIGPKVTTIIKNLFYSCNGIVELNIPDNVISIENYAFNGCSGIKSLHLGKGLKSIGGWCFRGNKSLSSLTIPDNVEAIGEYAFSQCKALTSVTVGNGVQKIMEGTFIDCINLEKVILGKSVTLIGQQAFAYNEKMTDFYCYASTPPSLQYNENLTFRKSGSTSTEYHPDVYLHVPAASLSAYKAKEPWKSFKSVTAIQVSLESLTLTSHEVLMGINSTYRLSCSFMPSDASNKNVTWSSSDNNIATVSNGLVSAKAVGEAYIYAISNENPEIKDSCLVTVVVPVEGITISQSECTLAVGNSLQLETAINPANATNKKVSWDSSNESVCIVKDGIITAIAKGISIITVTTEEGKFRANCTVTVVQPVTNITLDHNTYELHGIGASGKLTATVEPEDASNKDVTWKSSNESVCVVSNGAIIAVGYGEAVIIATSVDGGHMAICSVKVDDNTPVREVDAEASAYKVFSLQGIELSKLQKGINIIRFPDGTTKRIMIK